MKEKIIEVVKISASLLIFLGALLITGYGV